MPRLSPVSFRVIGSLVFGVALWQSSVMLRSGTTCGNSEIDRLRRQVSALEQKLKSRGSHVHRTSEVGQNSSYESPLMIPIRGGLPEQVNVNFTLFDSASLALHDAVRTTHRTNVQLFIIIVTSQSARAAKQRRLIRATWLDEIQQRHQGAIAARFFVGITGRQSEPVEPSVAAESALHGDIAIVDVGDQYGGLIAKVQASMQWVIAHYSALYVGKFDDDCYVAPTALLSELSQLPTERLYWGKMMGGGPVQRSGNRNSEPNLPKGVNWFPPYASGGGGYVLSWDLVHAVAFPPVKLLQMVNEDGHMGLFLLPYDVARRSSHKVHPYGIQRDSSGKCISAKDIIAIHYVKDAAEHDCMSSIHANVSAGTVICESRFCGPTDCNFTFPRPRKSHRRRCKSSNTNHWKAIDSRFSCEVNPENITRFFVAKRMRDLSCCQQLCEELCDCAAVDYYHNTAWCNLYTVPCTSPRKGTEGASSWRLDRVAG